MVPESNKTEQFRRNKIDLQPNFKTEPNFKTKPNQNTSVRFGSILFDLLDSKQFLNVTIFKVKKSVQIQFIFTRTIEA